MTADHSYCPRAQRYAVPLPVLFRASGERVWREGQTENISKSGVLVRALHVLQPEATVEMLITIPENIPTPFAGATICRGRIVRAIGPSRLQERPAFAAAILEFETAGMADPRRI